ncbi:MAG: ATP-binding cassette domain-containing protein [Tetragenococcus koreensis]|uniref:ATP-binding cassette domain-containing protein n=1 Tax=Tetragenococcus halophilus TaxID=51669 RepID=UPI001F2C33E5|nr:ATP-binding cassette domain-containing protein [Tetragenococcus halophilus]MDN6140473.1 ATP-binding cassette domain-containing protein [Tetragenococcus koreensis]MDN6385677.1 ATP-binding cassette domain-containing protein [Alkalibacterium sp.]MDN6626801.1 ATP-binding cassette domain-containing protein [Pisciglobus halotolerans]MDN6749775.1 ATP-binding cassette domain-containing protein [Staphylococcus equorum]MCF1675042.1 ATP-binding cassette domain-containing protein [Tetragenococcus halop
MQYAIEVSNLKKSYKENQVIRGIDLQVKKGELFAFLGPNGAGKTTVIHMLSTLLKPDGGTIFIQGLDAKKYAKDVRKKISLTGQFAALDEELTGLQNLTLIAKLHGHSNKQAHLIANELICAFDLYEAKNRMVVNYSGGMRRRMDIAASIITQPEVIFLDEPTTGLDPQSRMQVWEIVRRLLTLGTTVLLTTQYLEEADQLADRIAVIDNGMIIAEGTPNQLKASIGEKTLTFRLNKPYDRKKVHKILIEQHALNIVEAKNPLSFKLPVTKTRLANNVIDTLLKHKVPVEDFNLSDPSLDDVFLALTNSEHEEEVVQ